MKRVVWNDLSAVERSRVLERPAIGNSAELSKKVAAILSAVKDDGDAAILRLTEEFDMVRLESLEVTAEEVREAYDKVDAATIDAMKEASLRIELFHRAQLPVDIRVETAPGVICERKFRPISRVGLYIPGGTAPLPSTVLMLGVPAKIANCPLRVLATPPRKDGSVDPHILVAAKLLGITKIYKIGGAQAIGALAFGTESVPKVDKIFGPGNAWVTEAKMQVAQEPRGAACDLPAGPSEVLVIADRCANPRFVASDLLSQAEHGADSQVLLVSDSASLIDRVIKEVFLQIETLPRQTIAREALSKSFAIETSDLAQAIEISNAYAPEHLIVQVEDARSLVPRIQNAGSVFLGAYSPESAGDYSSGTNHVLPTYGYARAYGGVTTESFLKSISFQELSAAGLRVIGPGIERLAEIEGLLAHRNAVTNRLEALR